MIALVNGDGFTGHDAGTDTAGAREILRPVGAEIKTRAAQLFLKTEIAKEVDANALCVRQKQHVVVAGDLFEQGLQTGSRRRDQAFGLFLVLFELLFGDDMRPFRPCRIHAVGLNTAPPAFGDKLIPAGFLSFQNPVDFADMFYVAHAILPWHCA